MSTGCESCDMHVHPDAAFTRDWRNLHRAVHAFGATVMLQVLLPFARGSLSLLTHGTVPVDEDKVARWEAIAEQDIDRGDTT